MCRIFCPLCERRLCEITADSHKREVRIMVEMKCLQGYYDYIGQGRVSYGGTYGEENTGPNAAD